VDRDRSGLCQVHSSVYVSVADCMAVSSVIEGEETIVESGKTVPNGEMGRMCREEPPAERDASGAVSYLPWTEDAGTCDTYDHNCIELAGTGHVYVNPPSHGASTGSGSTSSSLKGSGGSGRRKQAGLNPVINKLALSLSFSLCTCFLKYTGPFACERSF
jgi:hypothetical protein